MKWNVYIEDINSKRIKVHNIFDHYSFLKDCKEAHKKYRDDKEAFLTRIKNLLRYYYWSKCEWEIVLSDWPPSEKFSDEKIDVYKQVMLNWDVFSEYVWENRDDLKRMNF